MSSSECLQKQKETTNSNHTLVETCDDAYMKSLDLEKVPVCTVNHS